MTEIVYLTTAGVCADCQGNCQPQRLICSKCAKARKANGHQVVREAPPQPTADALTKPWSPYRCRAHHDTIVTAKGRGCPQCPSVKR